MKTLNQKLSNSQTTKQSWFFTFNFFLQQPETTNKKDSNIKQTISQLAKKDICNQPGEQMFL
jgi:hypothetical protein